MHSVVQTMMIVRVAMAAVVEWQEGQCDVSKWLFLAGVVQFFLRAVLLTEEKVVHTTLCMT